MPDIEEMSTAEAADVVRLAGSARKFANKTAKVLEITLEDFTPDEFAEVSSEQHEAFVHHTTDLIAYLDKWHPQLLPRILSEIRGV